ncbi:hypothetical protein A2U01_0039841, partial [Trifolium medium]|nr:hypothetical protein [Trifolium medium]
MLRILHIDRVVNVFLLSSPLLLTLVLRVIHTLLSNCWCRLGIGVDPGRVAPGLLVEARVIFLIVVGSYWLGNNDRINVWAGEWVINVGEGIYCA